MKGESVMGEERILTEIKLWENELHDISNEFGSYYEDWMQESFERLPLKFKSKFEHFIEQWFLYTYTFLQSTTMQNDAIQRILQTARTYDDTIDTIEDLKELSIEKLTYLAEQQVARNRLYSFTQGGITGTGGWLLLGIDLPLIVTMNLRTVQLIGSSFGYNMNHPIEMLIALKVFHAGSLPKRMQYNSWNELKKSIEQQNSILEEKQIVKNEGWYEHIIKQIFKTIAIVSFKKKVIQGVPILSIGIGAVTNYRLARQISDFAKKFYQYRSITEKTN